MKDLIQQFSEVARALQRSSIRYAVVGGVAVAMHGGVRTTKDIDFLVHSEETESCMALLAGLGYRTPREALTFRKPGLTLRRMWKPGRADGDLRVFDLLLAERPAHRRMLRYALRLPWGRGRLAVLRPADLVQLKSARLSGTDQQDIEVRNMQRPNERGRAERAVRQVSELNDLVWELNRAGYRAGWHAVRPGWDLLAAVGVTPGETERACRAAAAGPRRAQGGR